MWMFDLEGRKKSRDTSIRPFDGSRTARSRYGCKSARIPYRFNFVDVSIDRGIAHNPQLRPERPDARKAYGGGHVHVGRKRFARFQGVALKNHRRLINGAEIDTPVFDIRRPFEALGWFSGVMVTDSMLPEEAPLRPSSPIMAPEGMNIRQLFASPLQSNRPAREALPQS